jgi:hypothetical protein
MTLPFHFLGRDPMTISEIGSDETLAFGVREHVFEDRLHLFHILR